MTAALRPIAVIDERRISRRLTISCVAYTRTCKLEDRADLRSCVSRQALPRILPKTSLLHPYLAFFPFGHRRALLGVVTFEKHNRSRRIGAMKKLITLLFTAALAFSLAMPVFAQEASPEKIPDTTTTTKTKAKKSKSKKEKKTAQQKTEEAPK